MNLQWNEIIASSEYARIFLINIDFMVIDSIDWKIFFEKDVENPIQPIF